MTPEVQPAGVEVGFKILRFMFFKPKNLKKSEF